MVPEDVIAKLPQPLFEVENVCVAPVRPLSEVIPESPLLTQLPLIEKHPAVRLMPFANVEEAEALVIFKRLVAIPPVNVDVAVVVAIIYPSVGDEVELRLVPSK